MLLDSARSQNERATTPTQQPTIQKLQTHFKRLKAYLFQTRPGVLQEEMLSIGRLKLHPNPERINLLFNKASPIILSSLISLVIFHGYLLIQQSNGGSDLVSADIPKSLMLLNGQNPYSTQPWASPYPPLLLLTVSGIIRVTSFFASQSSLNLISQQIRLAGLFADAAVAVIIYFAIRARTNNPLQALIPASLFLTLPAISTSPLYFFHSDTFGYPILALATLTLAQRRYFVGTTLLATATIFKVHPILALPLVMIWLIRTRGLRKTLPSIATATIITALGLILPLAIPGYQQSTLGFNITNQGNGTTIILMRLLNTILPSTVQFTPTEFFTNQIWIATTALLYTITVGTVWTKARNLSLIDVVLLGLVAWVIPLKIVYAHYIVWAIIPFIMRGRLKQTIITIGLLQLADTLTYWSSSPSNDPIPAIIVSYGPLLTSLIIRIIGATALVFVLHSLRRNPTVLLQKTELTTQTILVTGTPSRQGRPVAR